MDTTICSRGISGGFNKTHSHNNKKSKVSSISDSKGSAMVVPSGIPKFTAISSKRQNQQSNQYDFDGYSCNGIEGTKVKTTTTTHHATPRFETYMMTGDLILNIDPILPYSTSAPRNPVENTQNITLASAGFNNDEASLTNLQRVDYVVDGSVTVVLDNDGDRFHNGYGNKLFGSGDTYIYPYDNGEEERKSSDKGQFPLPTPGQPIEKCKGDWAHNSRSLPSSPPLKPKENVVEPITIHKDDVSTDVVATETSKTKLAALRENIEKHRLKNRLQNSLLQMNPDNPKITNGLPLNDEARSQVNETNGPAHLVFDIQPNNDLTNTDHPNHPQEKGYTNVNNTETKPAPTLIADATQELSYYAGEGDNTISNPALQHVRKPKPQSGRRQATLNEKEYYKSSFDQNKTLDLGGAHQHSRTVHCDFETFAKGSPPNFASLAAENNVSVSCQTLCFGLDATPPEPQVAPAKITATGKKGKTSIPTCKSNNSKASKINKSARAVGPDKESHQLENRLLWTVNNDRDMEMIAAAAAASNAFSSHYDQHYLPFNQNDGTAPGPADSINFIRNEEQKRTSERLLKIERRKRLVEMNKLKKLQQEQQQQLPDHKDGEFPNISGTSNASSSTNDHALNRNDLSGDKNVRDSNGSEVAGSTASEASKPLEQDSNQRPLLSPCKSFVNASSTASGGSSSKASYSSVTSSPSNSSSKSSSSGPVNAQNRFDSLQCSGVEPSLILTSSSAGHSNHPSSEYYIIEKQAAQRFLTVFESTSRMPPMSTTAHQSGLTNPPTGMMDKRVTDVLLQATSPFYGTEAENFIKRLFRLEGVDKVQVAQYLNFMADTNERLAEEFFNEFSFEKIPLDVALRNFFLHVSLVGENCEREKTLRTFSKYYYQFNPTSFISEDALHILVCALVLLNTDFYLCDIGKKMSCKEFITNLTSMGNYAKSYNKSYLKRLYFSIKEKPLQGITKTNRIQSQGSGSQSFVEQNPYLTVPPPYLNENIIVKQGFLRRKCYQDGNGRKSSFVRRNWKTFFAVLRGRILYLNKGCNVYDNALGNDYNSIRLHHALAQKSSEYIRKPFVFQLQTADWAIYFFQAGNLQDMEAWIESINLIAATFSALPLPSAIGCQKKFHRPLLPSLPTKHNMVEQFKQHESMVKELEKEINLLRENPPAPQWKSREIVEFKERENYYLYELKRYKTYSILLQRKLSKKENNNLKDSSVFQEDLAKPNRNAEAQKIPRFNSTKINESKNDLTPPKTISDRYSYKAAIYKTETERNYF